MNRFKKYISATLVTALTITAAATMLMAGNAKAIACFQYNPSESFPTSQTPVFNNICNVTSPLSSTEGNYPLGDETDFVRIRQNTSGSPLGSQNPKLVNSLTSACATGTKYDVWTYIHNDAEPEFNNNGSGSAVAHNVKLALSAPTGTSGKNFKFTSTISASNAATVSDSATLMCNGKAVKLTLVANSVKYNNDLSQTAYGSLPDGAVNGSTTLGNPTWGSGNVWGCWPYRTVVVYTVTVTEVPPTPSVTATCDIFTLVPVADKKRTVQVSNFKYTAKNTDFKSVVIDWADGSKTDPITDPTKVAGVTHQYAKDGTYVAVATVSFTNGTSNTNAGCQQKVVFTPSNPPIITPPTTPTPPTKLVNTGAGSVAGIFAATTIAGALGYRRFIARRLSR